MHYQIGDYEVIGYEPRYRQEVLDLLEPLWGPDEELRAACLDWKHFSNPYARDPFIHLVCYKERVVAVRAQSPCYWEAGQWDKRYRCVADVDAVVHPDHRRQGLLKQMIAIALKELEHDVYDFDITLSASPFSAAGNLMLGYANAGELRMMHWQAGQTWRDGNRLRRIARKLPLLPAIYRHFRKDVPSQQPVGSLFQSFAELDRNYERTKHFDGSGIVLEEKPRPETMAMLVSRQGYDGRIRHVRDQQFYAWRYQNPFNAYRYLFWEKDGLEGFLVLRQKIRDNSQSTFIVDWETTSAKVFSDLLQTVIRWGGFSSISIWSVTLPNDQIKMLVDHGFCAESQSGSSEVAPFLTPILVKPLHRGEDWSMGGRDLLNISNWDLRPIYADSY